MATGDQQSSVEAIWDTVRKWPTAERRSLASRIIASLGGDEANSPQELIGAWCDAGSPDDAAVKALLEDELLRKHG